MKKIIVLVCALMVVSMASIFAFGIGIQGGFNAGPSSGGDLAVTFKLDNVPFVFAGNLRFNSSGLGFGLTADQWVYTDTFIAAPFNWYIGWGLYGNIHIGNPFGLSLGARLPIGINAFFADGFIEPYLQVAPSIGLTILPHINFPDWFIPVNLGVRFWIK